MAVDSAVGSGARCKPDAAAAAAATAAALGVVNGSMWGRLPRRPGDSEAADAARPPDEDRAGEWYVPAASPLVAPPAPARATGSGAARAAGPTA